MNAEKKIKLEEELIIDLFKKQPDIVEDEKRLKNALKDVFPHDSLSINLFMDAYSLNIVERMKDNSLDKQFVKKLSDELVNSRGIQENYALSAVFLWCISYGKHILNKEFNVRFDNNFIQNNYNKTADVFLSNIEEDNRFKYQILKEGIKLNKYVGYTEETLVIPQYIDGCQVVSLAGYLFDHIKNIKKIILPEGLKIILQGTFRCMEDLEEINLPSSLKELYFDAFSGCKKLKMIIIPDGCKVVNGSPFQWGCDSIERIVYGNHYYKRFEEDFSTCPKLKALSLPEGLNEIYVPIEANRLERIYIPRTVKKICENAFDDCSRNLIIYCHSGSYAQEYARRKGMIYRPYNEFNI